MVDVPVIMQDRFDGVQLRRKPSSFRNCSLWTRFLTCPLWCLFLGLTCCEHAATSSSSLVGAYCAENRGVSAGAVLGQGCCRARRGATTGFMVQTVQKTVWRCGAVLGQDCCRARRGATTGGYGPDSAENCLEVRCSSWARLLSCPCCATTGVMVQTVQKTVWRCGAVFGQGS